MKVPSPGNVLKRFPLQLCAQKIHLQEAFHSERNGMKKSSTAKKELRSIAQKKLGALVSTEDPGEIYHLKTLLGKGSFGYVYHATHHTSQQVFPPETLLTS